MGCGLWAVGVGLKAFRDHLTVCECSDSTGVVTQNHAWVETSGALRTFQDWSVDVKPVLSKHLLFIELEPGDKIVEFIESEITGD